MVMKLKEKSLIAKKPLQVYVQNGEFVQYNQHPKYIAENVDELITFWPTSKENKPKYASESVDRIINGNLLVNWFSKKTPINLEEIESLFKLRNKETIKRFIQLKPFLIDILKNCYQQIRNYFSNDVKMELELLHDPMDNEEKLILYILTCMSPKDAIQTLIQFNKKWWIKNSVPARNYLSIDVESQCLTGPNI